MNSRSTRHSAQAKPADVYIGTKAEVDQGMVFLVEASREGQRNPLVIYPRWANEHDWDGEPGLRQLCLDLMIDYFGEQPTKKDLLAEEKAVMAWLPHLHYFGRMHEFLKPLWGRQVKWEIPWDHIDGWVDSWSLMNHRKFAAKKYGEIYLGEPYKDWRPRLDQLFADYGAPTLATANITEAWAWRAYLAGYMPSHIAYAWACDRITMYKKMLFPDNTHHLSTTWADTIPTPDDEPF